MPKNTQNIQDIITACKKRLEAVCGHELLAQQEAWWMLEQITGKKQSELLINSCLVLTPAQQAQLDLWITERVTQQKPLQYILGSVPFCDLEILVEPPILIPRPETEEWVSWLIKKLELVKNQKLSILDLCTGSGCIALALAQAFPLAQVIGVDKNQHALALAEKNKQHNKLTNVTFMLSDMYGVFDPVQQFDLIVSNPPYLSSKEWGQLDESVRAWEDYDALVADHEGYALYDRMLSQAKMYLKGDSVLCANNSPQVVFEIGVAQSSLQSWIEKFGFKKIDIIRDLEGAERWASIQV